MKSSLIPLTLFVFLCVAKSSVISILGASGRTGKYIVKIALEKGIKVKALLRTPSKLEDQKGLVKVQGDIKNQDAVDESIKGADVVIITLGAERNQKGVSILQDGVNAAVASMTKFKIKRLIVLTSAALNPNLLNPFITYFLRPFVLNHVYDDEEKAEKILDELDKKVIDWTLIQPKGLVPDCEPVGYVIGINSLVNNTVELLPFSDLAQAIFDIAMTKNKKEYSYERLFIGTKTNFQPVKGVDHFRQMKQIIFEAFYDSFMFLLPYINILILVIIVVKSFKKNDKTKRQ